MLITLDLFLPLLRSVHISACMYWRVKIESDPDNLEAFLASKDVDSAVRWAADHKYKHHCREYVNVSQENMLLVILHEGMCLVSPMP